MIDWPAADVKALWKKQIIKKLANQYKRRKIKSHCRRTASGSVQERDCAMKSNCKGFYLPAGITLMLLSYELSIRAVEIWWNLLHRALMMLTLLTLPQKSKRIFTFQKWK